MENDDSENNDLEEPGSLSETELIERITGLFLPDLSYSRLRTYTPEDWKNLEERIGTEAARILAAALELGRRMEEEND